MKLYIRSTVDDIFPESNPKTPPEMLREFAKSTRLSDKRMVAYNPSTPADVLSDLVQLKDDIVRSGVYHNPNTPEDIREKLYKYFESKGKSTMRAYHIAPNTPAFASKSLRRTTRIYAYDMTERKQTEKQLVDQFVGTDYWVKCYVIIQTIGKKRNGHKHTYNEVSGWYWVKFLSETDGYYTIRLLYDHLEWYGDLGDDSGFWANYNKEYTIYFGELTDEAATNHIGSLSPKMPLDIISEVDVLELGTNQYTSPN